LVRWKDAAKSAILVRRIEYNAEMQAIPEGSRWTADTSLPRVGLLFEASFSSRKPIMLEPEAWLASAEPSCGWMSDFRDPLTRTESLPDIAIEGRHDQFLVAGKSVGKSGRHYLACLLSPRRDAVAIVWASKRLSQGGIVFGGPDRWGGELGVEFRSTSDLEVRGIDVRLELPEDLDRPSLVWTADSSAVVVTDCLSRGFWFVPRPEKMEGQR
jgi:hypothetical protein